MDNNDGFDAIYTVSVRDADDNVWVQLTAVDGLSAQRLFHADDVTGGMTDGHALADWIHDVVVDLFSSGSQASATDDQTIWSD